jgi:hypothetical protein
MQDDGNFDYKKLLIAYATHILNMEGITYVNNYEEELFMLGLTQEEIEELRNII